MLVMATTQRQVRSQVLRTRRRCGADRETAGWAVLTVGRLVNCGGFPLLCLRQCGRNLREDFQVAVDVGLRVSH